MKFKSDKYKSNRGGNSQLLRISCRKCNNTILFYQKDGPGGLRRMYMDRILYPMDLMENQYMSLSNIDPLRCVACDEILAHPMLYKKENRIAYRLFVEAIIKTKVALKDFKNR